MQWASRYARKEGKIQQQVPVVSFWYQISFTNIKEITQSIEGEVRNANDLEEAVCIWCKFFPLPNDFVKNKWAIIK
jgi:serine protease inhibitor